MTEEWDLTKINVLSWQRLSLLPPEAVETSVAHYCMGFNTEPRWDEGLAVCDAMKSWSCCRLDCADVHWEEWLTVLQMVHLLHEFRIPLSTCWPDLGCWGYWLYMLFSTSILSVFFFCWQSLQKNMFSLENAVTLPKFLVLENIWVCVCFAIKTLNGS